MTERQFETAWNTALPAVTRIAALSGAGIDLDDVIQDARIRCWRSKDLYTGAATFTNWACTIVRNAAYDSIRNRRRSVRDERRAVPIEYAMGVASPGVSVLDQLCAEAEVSAIVEAAHEHLSPRRITMLQLAVDGYEYSQIATHFSCPRGTVRSSLNRARNTLKEAVGL